MHFGQCFRRQLSRLRLQAALKQEMPHPLREPLCDYCWWCHSPVTTRPINKIKGAGPSKASAKLPTVVRVTTCAGVEARETAAIGVSAAIPDSMSDPASALKSRPGI